MSSKITYDALVRRGKCVTERETAHYGMAVWKDFFGPLAFAISYNRARLRRFLSAKLLGIIP